MEHILTTDKAFTGLFASYHVYPYYPEFMNYSTEYQSWIDPLTNDINPYKAYLNDLINAHTMPVLVAEFGLPSSRGLTHENPQGFNQGGLSETEQAELLDQLITTIFETDAMGALIFSWQDEWFKRTWNTLDFDLSWRRPFWSNIETNEQFFGILALEPGTIESQHYVDDDLSDWENISPVIQSDGSKIYMDHDARYLYIMVENQNIDWENDSVYIPMNTIDNQGNESWLENNIDFDIGADFVVAIHGENDAHLYVDQYYDAQDFLYGDVLNLIEPSTNQREKNTGIFSPIYHTLSAAITLPETQTDIPFSIYEAGQLTYGNSNPTSTNYQSLADYYFGDGYMELRIPWLLLNIMDPSTKQIIADFNVSDLEYFVPETLSFISFQFLTDDSQTDLGTYTWDDWHTVTYYERLKPAYEVIANRFKTIHAVS